MRDRHLNHVQNDNSDDADFEAVPGNHVIDFEAPGLPLPGLVRRIVWHLGL